MKIAKNLKRFLASTLVLLQVGTLAGCHNENNSFKEVKDVKGTDSMTELILGKKLTKNKEEDSKIPVSTILVSEITTFLEKVAVLSKKPLAYNTQNPDFAEQYEEELHDYIDEKDYLIQISYALSIYRELKDKGIEDEVIAQELHNLMIEQLTPSDNFTDEEWIQLFGALLSNTSEEESFYEKHILLAWYTHRSVCEEEHTITEYGAITCPVIEKQNILIKK